MKTILDTEEPLSQTELVDAYLEGFSQHQQQLVSDLVDEAVADEAFRREALDKLLALGTGKRGSLAPPAMAPLIDALIAAGYERKEIVEQLILQFGARNPWRDLRSHKKASTGRR